MTGAGGSFPDLALRTTSGVLIAALGLGAIWVGGIVFLALAAAIAALMVWELARMLDPDGRRRIAVLLAGVAGVAVAAALNLPPPWDVLDVVLIAAFALVLPAGQRRVFALVSLGIVLASVSMVLLRAGHGPYWMFWLALVVVASDVAGYFAGRFFGGPKFWPRISPKKTWSGTVAGWVGAAAVGAAFMQPLGAGGMLVALSVIAAMAAQAGDIAESWVKRRMSVKDASAILPGHGGLMDRFDGLTGAALFLFLYQQLAVFPPAAGG